MRSRRQMNRTQFGCQSNPSLHYFFLIVFSHCCVILLSSPVTALIAIPPSPTSGGRSAVKIRSRQNSSSSSELCSTLSFSGDASCTLEMKDASVESVSDFLQSPSSDIYLLGTSNCSKQDEENTGRSKQEKKTKEDGESQLWECKQPVVDFMGLTLQPVFVNKVLRASQGRVVVSIEDARTDIVKASKSPGSRAVTSILESSTFKGESVFSVQSPHDGEDNLDESCTISIELRLTLLIPLPSYMPVPPGFNALGSAIVRRTGKSRTKKLLRRLREAYYEDCEEKSQNPTSNKSVSD
ncbi:unnamed protein product [Cylindrotheca closterium]|uniref:Uncharacterized protein n=1 Tax=Cylindrotheca closterium TaxID=2856 RepID=A0AAD2JGS1_9STRA|nr:unnamed protein product [Cylindrotheca closterium]